MALIEVRHIDRNGPGGRNRPGDSIAAEGLVIHTTDNPESSAADHERYWGAAYRKSSAHLVVDWDRSVELIPWQPGVSERALHAGPRANSRFIGMEICETSDPVKFARCWGRSVATAAEILKTYGQGTDWALAHVQVTRWFGGTDHQDPIPYFSRWTRTWAEFLMAVHTMLRGTPGAPVPERRPVPVVDLAGRQLAEGWLEGDQTVVFLREIAESQGLLVRWDTGRKAATLAWPGEREEE